MSRHLGAASGLPTHIPTARLSRRAALLACAVALLVAAPAHALRPAAARGPALLVLDAADAGALARADAAARAAGGKLLHRLPPRLAWASVPAAAVDELRAVPGVLWVSDDLAADPPFDFEGPERAFAMLHRKADLFEGRADPAALAPASLRAADLHEGLDGLPDCLFAPDAERARPSPSFRGGPPAVPAPTSQQTSEFLAGHVAVAVIALESNGAVDPSTENWAANGWQYDFIQTRVMDAMAWFASVQPLANLSFSWEFHLPCSTSYEPINRPSWLGMNPGQKFWVKEVMDSLGFSGATIFEQTRAFDDDLRRRLGADWGITIFLVNSTADPDGRFTDGVFAYTYAGGPFQVMTWDNGDYKQPNMDAVCAHETSHLFWAFDEYPGSFGCADSTGYLAVRNGNAQAACVLDEHCLMRSFADMVPGFDDTMYCSYSRQQVGWRDTDGDSIQDVLDTWAGITLVFPEDTTTAREVPYAGWATEVPLPNRNPFGVGADVSLQHVTGVEYRVDGGIWTGIDPVDFVFDERQEEFAFTTPTLSVGPHVVEVRAWNSAGNVSPVAVDTVFVADSAAVAVEVPAAGGGTRLLDARPNPFNPEARIVYESDGGAPLTIDVHSVSGALVRTLVAGERFAGRHEVRWDGADERGRPLASGIYFLRLSSGSSVELRKVTLLR